METGVGVADMAGLFFEQNRVCREGVRHSCFRIDGEFINDSLIFETNVQCF